DTEAIRSALDHVLAVRPDDEAATRYKAILDRGEADPDTPELALVFLGQHLQAGRLAEAAREAEKILAHNPKHWLARCVLAHHALGTALATGDVPVLIHVAAIGPRMRAALALLRANDPVRLPEDRFNVFAKAIDDRTRRAWQAVREKAPDRPEGYCGLARL